ncbi:hypothetical protein Tco_1436238 [Tanacetum coccineum]
MPITLRPLTLLISMGENPDDEADERTAEEYLRDLELEFHERALLASSKRLVAKVKKEAEHEPQDIEPIPITIVRPIAKSSPEVEHIGSSSSRPQLTNIVIDITPPKEQPDDPPHTTPKDNRGNGIAGDIDESPCKLVPASKEIRPDPDTPVLICYEINGKMYQLSNEKIQTHMEKEERLERAS